MVSNQIVAMLLHIYQEMLALSEVNVEAFNFDFFFKHTNYYPPTFIGFLSHSPGVIQETP